MQSHSFTEASVISFK